MREQKRPRFSIELEPLPSPVPLASRLRLLLKRALRDWGLKCTAIRGLDGAEELLTRTRLPGEGSEPQ